MVRENWNVDRRHSGTSFCKLTVSTANGEKTMYVAMPSTVCCWLNNRVVHKLSEAAIEFTSVFDAA